MTAPASSPGAWAAQPLTAAQATAADFDRYLGDPLLPGTPFSYRDTVQSEERDELPAGAVETLRQWGLHHYLVPEELGGRLRGLEELFLAIRTLSQRNLTLAVMHGSAFLGALPVWLWGSEQQKKEVATEILGGGLAAFAVSEADHGSDISASETVALTEGDGLVLTGSKWPAGNATRARFVSAFARTGRGRSFSILLVDKEKADPATWSHLPFVKTVGLRGHDLSGIAFDGCGLPASAVIGPQGAGLAQTLKLLQVTRTAVAALSLGTMDAAVRIALDYAHQRRLYGRPIYALPVIRDELVKAHADVLIGECLAVPAARALSILPGRLSLWSSIAKYFTPVIAEEVLNGMAGVLGARSYLREGVADGVFQKLRRDHAIASIFEGTTHVNLHSIAHQLPFVLAQPEDRADAEGEDGYEQLAAMFSLSKDAPAWRPDGRRLQLTNEGRDEVTHSWDPIRRQIAQLAATPGCPPVHRDLDTLITEIDTMRERCYAGIPDSQTWDSTSVRALTAAEHHCVFHAAASCLLTWLCNRDDLGGEFAAGHWLVLCLHRLIQRLRPDRHLPEAHVAAFEEGMLRRLQQGTPFSLVGLAGPETRTKGECL
jgi:alkylation response protein AidB-like acyl-CoA dehydrogenase